MDPALQTAATGMKAQQTRVEVISNNLANVNTTGFKRSRAHFEDLLYQTVQEPGTVDGADAGTTPEIQVGRGTRLAAVQRVEMQGPIEETGRPLDFAIEGEGFFQVQLPDGTLAYTRDGSLHDLRPGDAGDPRRLHGGAGHHASRTTPWTWACPAPAW